MFSEAENKMFRRTFNRVVCSVKSVPENRENVGEMVNFIKNIYTGNVKIIKVFERGAGPFGPPPRSATDVFCI